MYALIIHFYCYIFYPYDCMDLYCKINVNLNDEETRLLFSDFFRRLSAFYSRTEGSTVPLLQYGGFL